MSNLPYAREAVELWHENGLTVEFLEGMTYNHRVQLVEAARRWDALTSEAIDIVFDGPPSPQEGGCSSPHFVEVENQDRHSIRIGEWVERDDGYWVLRLRAVAGVEEGNQNV